MNKRLMNFAVIMLTMIYATLAFAKPGFEGIEDARFERMRRFEEKRNKTDVVTWLGKVHCKNGQQNLAHDCDLEFVREDGKSFSLENSEELKKLHCERNADLEIKLTAEKKPHLLFWGENLVVKNFEILGLGKAGICEIKFEQEKQKASPKIRERKIGRSNS